MKLKLIALASVFVISGCSGLSDIRSTYENLTTSSLVGTWIGKGKCNAQVDTCDVVLTFKQSNFPLIALGVISTRITEPNKHRYASAVSEGEVNPLGDVYINEKHFLYNQNDAFELTPWTGKKVDENTMILNMLSNIDGVGGEAKFTKVSDSYIGDDSIRAAFTLFDEHDQ